MSDPTSDFSQPDADLGAEAANADNAELPDRVPDPMTDDQDAGETSTDADAEDARAEAERLSTPASPAGLSDDEADRAVRHD